MDFAEAGVSLLLKYFPELSEAQKKGFYGLYDCYKDWNSKINVISRKDFDSLYERHILHSLSIARFISFRKDAEVLDVGTGGGFPGVPLAIMFPETNFHLVDSIGKKIKVVNGVADTLGLTNVNTTHGRVEDLPGKFDFIVSRAVTEFNEFYGWVKPKFKTESNHSKANGIIYLKGGDLNRELAPFKARLTLISLSDYFSEEFFETKKLVYLPVKG